MPQYRPSVTDFQTNFLPVSIQSAILRKVEAPICDRLRSYVNEQLKRFHEQTFLYADMVSNKIKSSTSTSVSDAITAVQKANDAAITTFITLSDKYLKDINDNCPKLGTAAAIRDVNKKVLESKAAQLGAGFKLVAQPANLEMEMQANYKPVEDIILTM